MSDDSGWSCIHVSRELWEGTSWEYIFWWQARRQFITPEHFLREETSFSSLSPVDKACPTEMTIQVPEKKKNPLISSGLGLSWMNKPLCLWEKLLCVHPNLCPPSPGQQLDYTFRPSCSWVWIEFWQKNVGGNAICHFQTRTIKTPVCPSTSHTLSSPSAGWRERGQSHNVEGAWDPEQTWRLMSIWGSELIEKYTCDVETKAFESSLF